MNYYRNAPRRTSTGRCLASARDVSSTLRGAVSAAALIVLFLSADVATGEAAFSGELQPEVGLSIPHRDNYESPLNPGNVLGVRDVTFRSEINLQLTDTGETGALDVWLQLKQYPIAELLTGVSSATAGASGATDSEILALEQAVADIAFTDDAYIYTVDLLRASAAWTPTTALRVTLGRQSYLTGYGYGWNPVDLANPPKDPTDADAALRGVDGLTVQYAHEGWLLAKVYGALPTDGRGWDYDELLAGAELTLLARAAEIKVAGLYGGVERSSDAVDTHPAAAAAGLYADVGGVGLYGEGVVRSRSRRTAPEATGAETTMRDGPIPSGLLGLEYYFPAGPSLVAEYFYNGEGWDRDQRRDYANALDALDDAGGITGEYCALYTPSYFARHYGLLNLTIPWYDVDTTFDVNLIYSPDSHALFVTPTVSVNLNYEGTLSTELRYGGQFSLDDGERNEVWLSPVRHGVVWSVQYFF